MKQFSYVLTNENALQTKHMGNLSREASRFKSRVRLINGTREAEAEQLRQVLELGMKCGNQVVVTVEGKDEEAAVAAMQDYFVANM